MKKHHMLAMLLSVLSAGVIIGCSQPSDTANKPNESGTNADETNSQTSSQANNQNAKTDVSSENKPTSIAPIELSAQTRQQYLTQVAKTQIVPAYQDVTKQSQQLFELANKHCKAVAVAGNASNSGLTGDELQALRTQWLKLAEAWAKAEMVNFGPAMDAMSNLYINYFPDERGLVQQGVIDLVDANPNLTPEQLARESAVVQGIPGLEEVLYANDTLTAGQCQYVMSASSALTTRLTEVQKAWDTSAPSLLGIDEDEGKLGLNRWINSLLSLVETTKSNAIDKPLGLTAGKDGAKKGHLPADGAGQSRAIIMAKVTALNTALTDPAFVAMLAEHNQDTLSDKLASTLADSNTLLAQMPEDIADATPDQQRKLYDHLTTLTQIIKRELMPTLGVQVGFNSTDGD